MGSAVLVEFGWETDGDGVRLDWSVVAGGGGNEGGGAATKLLFELSRLQLPQAVTTWSMLRAYYVAAYLVVLAIARLRIDLRMDT